MLANLAFVTASFAIVVATVPVVVTSPVRSAFVMELAPENFVRLPDAGEPVVLTPDVGAPPSLTTWPDVPSNTATCPSVTPPEGPMTCRLASGMGTKSQGI